MIPDSAMVMRCCELLRGHIRHNMLTGWSYDEIGYTPEMKAMGLSEVSSNKKEGDSEFILRQLAERVPLSFWCEVYGCGKEEAARKFAKHPPFRKFLELEDPILNFSDGLWAFHTLKEDPSYLRKPELVAMLTPPSGRKSAGRKRSGISDSYPTHGTATTTRHGARNSLPASCLGF